MRYTLLCVLIVLLATSAFATQLNFGYGEAKLHNDGPCLTQAQRTEIQANIDRNARLLEAEGKLQYNSSAIVAFAWPLKAAPALTDPGYHGVSNFVDHNAAVPNQLRDYTCGTRTYDQASGYNHSGTDYFTWPYWWNKMDNNEVQIVASAAGTITFKSDGNFDRSCGLGGGNWNAVYVKHADGSVAWYGHMKKNSLTPKIVGAAVAQGEYLGIVGSSGNSTGPHLHFEVYDVLNNLIDPYNGVCNANPSWWAAQRPYYDKAINKISTHSTTVAWGTCPNQDVTNEQNVFPVGPTVYFYTFGRDGVNGDQYAYSILRPDNTVYSSWNWVFNLAPHYSSYWLYWWFNIPGTEPQGVWTYRVVYQGVTYNHNFTIGTVVPVALQGYDSRWAEDHVEIAWRLTGVEGELSFDVSRASGESAAFIPVYAANVARRGEDFIYADRAAEPGKTYRYRVAIKEDGAVATSFETRVTTPTARFALAQNHPNPFNPTTTINFSLDRADHAYLAIHDVAGRLVRTLVDRPLDAGFHSERWDGLDLQGRAAASGIYFYRLSSGKHTLTRKAVLLK